MTIIILILAAILMYKGVDPVPILLYGVIIQITLLREDTDKTRAVLNCIWRDTQRFRHHLTHGRGDDGIRSER